MTVAVLAGGVDPTAPGLAGDVTTGPSFGNVAGDTNAAGTVFASGVAGRGPSGSNPAGTLGLAPAARILAERVPSHGGNGPFQRAYAAAIRYAAGHGAQVIYVAGEAYQDAAVLDRAVEYAVARNAVVISPEYPGRGVPRNASTVPGSLPGVLGAASVLLPGMTAPSKFVASPANESILVAAPADVLTVTGPLGQGYTMFNSLASAAWLAATVALIKSVYPHLPASLVDLAIARSARDQPQGRLLGAGGLWPARSGWRAARGGGAGQGPGHRAGRGWLAGRLGPLRRRAATRRHRRGAPLDQQAGRVRRRHGGRAAAARHGGGTGVALERPSRGARDLTAIRGG